MTQAFRLSIITINFNNVHGLRATFKSVFTQSNKQFEYIVIDGGSSDGSKELILQNQKEINYWVSEKDNGIYNAINKGLRQARGEYILVLNSGDILFSNDVIERALPHLSGVADFISGNILAVNHLDGSNDHLWEMPEKVNFETFRVGALGHGATFIKRKMHERFGYYDESFKIVSDWIFMLKALSTKDVSYKKIDETISCFDKSGVSSTQRKLLESERDFILERDFKFFLPLGLPSVSIKKSILDWKKWIKFLVPYGIVRLFMSRD